MNNLFKPTLFVGLAATPLFGIGATAEKPQNPNIVLIFMDDLGYGDLSCYGASQYKTPNLDRMATQGVRFTNFVSAQAVCSASRAGILTGCYPNRVGISGALMPDAKIGLNPSEEIISEVLKKRNYKTAAIGKWHLGHQREFLPLQQGFDEYLGLPYSNDMWPVNFDGKPAAENSNKARYPVLPLLEGNDKIREIRTLDDQSELTTIYTERAVRFITENRKNPFFLYLAHSMPHIPLAVSGKFKGKSGQGMYGDVMMEIDWSVGEIIKALERNGLEKNTLVIFTSDNGPWLNFGNHAGSTGGFGDWGFMITMGVIFVIFYFLLIRPQQKKQKELKNMLGSLAYGDTIVTTGGIHGKVTGLSDSVITLEIADKVRIKVSRAAIGTILQKAGASATKE